MPRKTPVHTNRDNWANEIADLFDALVKEKGLAPSTAAQYVIRESLAYDQGQLTDMTGAGGPKHAWSLSRQKANGDNVEDPVGREGACASSLGRAMCRRGAAYRSYMCFKHAIEKLLVEMPEYVPVENGRVILGNNVLRAFLEGDKDEIMRIALELG
jgi:hypothetical protein